MQGSENHITERQFNANLEFFVEVLQLADIRVQAANFVRLELHLLFQVLDLVSMRLALGSELCLKFALIQPGVYQALHDRL